MKDSLSEHNLISVIVPAYNAGPYLSACIDSILDQTLQSIEIIIVDDGSSDETGTAADHFLEIHPDRITVIHTENRGVTNARLTGVEKAKGNWIGFVDGDDEIEPDMYERLLNNAIKYGADISHCGTQTIVNGGERVHYFYNTGREVLQDHLQGVRDLLEGKFVEPSLCNKLFKKELLLDLISSDVMDRSIRFNEDLLMNYHLFKQAHCSIYEDFCGYHYMARSGSATRSGRDLSRLLDPVKVNRYILDHEDGGLQKQAELNYTMACMRAYEQISLNRAETELADRLKKEILKYKDLWKCLRRNDRLKIYMLMASPYGYSAVSRFIHRLKKKSVYE